MAALGHLVRPLADRAHGERDEEEDQATADQRLRLEAVAEVHAEDLDAAVPGCDERAEEEIADDDDEHRERRS